MEDRPSELLGEVDRSSKILEIGPSFCPMAPRSAGWDTTVVDHATQDELIAKYRCHPNVNVANIEHVDIVWRNGALHEAVPADRHGTFDVLIASHVIEHLPNPIGFLESALHLLHPERGMLALAVPDKRWCFDCLKQVTTTGQLISAHRMRRQRHDLTTRFDFLAYIAFDGQRVAWGRERLQELRLGDTLEHAYSEFLSWRDDADAPYVDCHAWHFTPSSFELLILELGALGLIDWQISWLKPRPEVEFFVRLSRGHVQYATPEAREARRLELLKRVLLEIREQTDWLLPAESGQPDPAALLSPSDSTAFLRLRADLASARDALAAAEQQIANLHASTSWRMMAPLRSLVRLTRGR